MLGGSVIGVQPVLLSPDREVPDSKFLPEVPSVGPIIARYSASHTNGIKR